MFTYPIIDYLEPNVYARPLIDRRDACTMHDGVCIHKLAQ